jgi:hypothetical protein
MGDVRVHRSLEDWVLWNLSNHKRRFDLIHVEGRLLELLRQLADRQKMLEREMTDFDEVDHPNLHDYDVQLATISLSADLDWLERGLVARLGRIKTSSKFFSRTSLKRYRRKSSVPSTNASTATLLQTCPENWAPDPRARSGRREESR